jgi:D-aminoacyl-tRNA deacylase
LGTKFWPDENDKPWKVDIKSGNFQLLLVSQFTLYAKCYKKGKLDFHHAMSPDPARALYNDMVSAFCGEIGGDRVQTGEFGAMMQVSIENDGPVTVMFDSEEDVKK